MKIAGHQVSYGLALSIACVSVSAQTPPPHDNAQHIRHLESCIAYPVVLDARPNACLTLQEQMQALHVPGVSIALIQHGEIQWAKGFGVARLNGQPVNDDTIFQAGSISKPVAAVAALRLVQDGKLSLDEDVNAELTGWKIPPSAAAQGKAVTLRELLTHTAGLNVHGFPGYEAGTPVPTLIQILNGQKPANTDAIRVESVPGTQWKYSGGGFTVMQLLLQDVTKQPFAQFVHEAVLRPVDMSHSTFVQPLPEPYGSRAATPYDDAGKPVKGGPHTYPEQAAAGLWATPSDLARFVMEIQKSMRGDANHVLSENMVRQMLTPGLGGWGLGVEIGGAASNPYFDHDGSDAGFESTMIGYEKSGDGAVVMTNGENGGLLAQWIIANIAKEYGWPDFKPVVRRSITLKAVDLSRFVGTYEFSPGDQIVITRREGGLVGQTGNQPALNLYPRSENTFFNLADTDIDFVSGADGQIRYLLAYHDGHNTQYKAIKK